MDCVDYYLADLIFGCIWVFICVGWTLCFTCFFKRYAVFLHLILNGMISLKIIPAFNVLCCLIQVKIDWLEVPMYILIGIIDMLDFFSALGVIYFISIGFGFCDVLIPGINLKAMSFVFTLCYVSGGFVYFYPTVGYLLVAIYFQIAYIVSLMNIQNTIAFIRDLGYEFGENKIEIIRESKSCIFLYCHVFSIYYTVVSLNFYWLGLHPNLVFYYKSLEVIFLLRILYLYRPRFKARFSEDFLFPQRVEPLNFLEARISSNYRDFTHPHCVIVVPDQRRSLMYGKQL